MIETNAKLKLKRSIQAARRSWSDHDRHPHPAQRNVLLHTLGLDWTREPYRNHFVACPGHDDLPHLEALVAAGLMEQRRRPGFLPEDDLVFAATEAGRELALTLLPKVPRDRGRYRRWLSMRDVDADLSFGEYLRRRLYKEMIQ